MTDLEKLKQNLVQMNEKERQELYDFIKTHPTEESMQGALREQVVREVYDKVSLKLENDYQIEVEIGDNVEGVIEVEANKYVVTIDT
jgi:hypothetical protein